MNKNEILQIIRALSDANGVSGFEDECVALLSRYAAPYGVLSEDSLRNLYVQRAGNSGQKPRVMLDAHSDEVGFIVQAILPNGMLKILPLGSWIPYHVPAHKVRVQNRDGLYIPAVVAGKPSHYVNEAERNSCPPINEMFVDIGSRSKEETIEAFGIRLAAPVVPDVAFTQFEQNDLFMGKAFDCRLGCAALLATLDGLQGEALSVDVVAAFASQEEVGTRGVDVSSSQVQADLAIVFEGTPADDTFLDASLAQTAVGAGPMLRHMDRSMITNPRFQRFALDLAEEFKIPVQEAVRNGGGTDAGIIHRSHKGVPSIVIGVPVRYAHTHHGISAYSDVKAAADLGAALLRRLDAEMIGRF